MCLSSDMLFSLQLELLSLMFLFRGTHSELLPAPTTTNPTTTLKLAGELLVEAGIDISPASPPLTNEDVDLKVNTNTLPLKTPSRTKDNSLNQDDNRCGIRIKKYEQPSKEAQIGQWPWIVALYYGVAGGKTHIGCVGSLISPRHVLTVAKCADTEDIDLLHQGLRLREVRLGDVNLIKDPDCSFNGTCADPSFMVPVSSVHLHPDVNKTVGVYRNDLAIITLATSVRFSDYVRAVCLPFEISLYGIDLTRSSWNDNVETAGWGTRGPVFYSQDNPVLYHKSRRIISTKLCTDWQPSFQLQQNIHLCTSIPKSGGLDLLCTGGVGYGAPLVKTDSLGRSILLGVLSAERRLCPGSRHTVYANVVPALSWILMILHS